MGFHDSLVPLVVCAVYEQVKFRPKKKVKMRVSHSVVAVGTVCVCVAGWGWGKHDMNLISAISLI